MGAGTGETGADAPGKHQRSRPTVTYLIGIPAAVACIYLGLYFRWRWVNAMSFRDYQSYEDDIPGRHFEWVVHASSIADDEGGNETFEMKLFQPLIWVEVKLGTLTFVSE